MIVRYLKLLDVPMFLKWLWDGREQNDVDFRILDYPTFRVVAAEKDGKPQAFLPLQTCIVLESLALGPELEPKEKLDSVVEMVHNIGKEAFREGIRELYYISSDERTDESAVRQLGFERVVAYRKRLLVEDESPAVGETVAVRRVAGNTKKRSS